MMLRPAAVEIVAEGQSIYGLVVAVAKRARQITQESEDNKTILTEKPVKLAVEEYAAGKYRIIDTNSGADSLRVR